MKRLCFAVLISLFTMSAFAAEGTTAKPPAKHHAHKHHKKSSIKH